MSVLHQERLQTTGEVGRLEQTNVLGIDRVGLLLVEAGRIGVDLGDVEGRNHLVEREDIVIVGDAPPEQSQVVQQSLGNEAPIAVDEEVGLGIALGKLLVALTHHERQVPERRCEIGDTDTNQCLVQRELTRSRGQQIFAAQYMGDLHQRVVDRVDQRVQRNAVAASQREVRNRCLP